MIITYRMVLFSLTLAVVSVEGRHSDKLGHRHGGNIDRNRINELSKSNRGTKASNSFYDVRRFRHAMSDRVPVINRTLSSTNVTGQLGGIVYLHCYVHNIGEKTVTWLRSWDYHVIAVGMVVYSSDERFSAVHRDEFSSSAYIMHTTHGKTVSSNLAADDWILQIRGVQKDDEGQYECQVNTRSPMLSTYVTLNVLSPYASIVEGVDDISVGIGGDLKLTCVIHDCLQPPTHIFWYQGGRVLNYDFRDPPVSLSAGSVKVINRPAFVRRSNNNGRNPAEATVPQQVLSQLIIRSVSKRHTGTYTCAPVDCSPATVHVSIVHAEEQVSRQYSSPVRSYGPPIYSMSTVGAIGLVLLVQTAFLFLLVDRTT